MTDYTDRRQWKYDPMTGEPLPAKSKGALSHEENKRHNKMILDKFYSENEHLYTAPPQRQQRTYTLRKWQGLTDDEILEEYRQSYGDDGDLTDVYFARAIEAKLKEKNSG